MTADLSGAYAKIERADQHIAELVDQVRLVHDADPYRVERQGDQQANRTRWILRHMPVYPPALSLIVGDAAHNLRSALDHLACEAVRSNGAPVTTDIAFPVWRPPRKPTVQDLKAMAGGKVKGSPKAFIDAIFLCEPYPGGNHQFVWEVDYLDLIDKHRALVLVSASHQTLLLNSDMFLRHPAFDAVRDQMTGPSITIGLVPTDRCPLNEGDEVFSTPFDDHQWDDVQFAFDVAIGEPGILECEPICPRLTQLSQAVRDFIDTLSALL